MSMLELPRPRPVQVLICEVCHESWAAHYRRARNRLNLDEDDDEVHLTEEMINNEVNLGDCVTLLQIANQGPVGPVGAQGPMGIAGLPA